MHTMLQSAAMGHDKDKQVGSRKRAGRPPAADNVDRRKAIFDAAIELFAKNGFSRVDFSQIAEKAGVTTSLVRHYFGSKDNLVNETTKQVVNRLDELYENITSSENLSGDEDIFEILYNRNTENLFSNYGLLFFLKQMAIELPERSFPIFRKHFMVMQTQLGRLEASGQIQPGVNTVWLALMLIFVQFGPIFLERQIEDIIGVPARDHEAMRRRNKSIRRALKYGILPRNAASD